MIENYYYHIKALLFSSDTIRFLYSSRIGIFYLGILICFLMVIGFLIITLQRDKKFESVIEGSNFTAINSGLQMRAYKKNYSIEVMTKEQHDELFNLKSNFTIS